MKIKRLTKIKLTRVDAGYKVKIRNHEFRVKEIEFEKYRVFVDASKTNDYEIRDQPECGGSCTIELTTRQFLDLERQSVIFESWDCVATASDADSRFWAKFRFHRAEWN